MRNMYKVRKINFAQAIDLSDKHLFSFFSLTSLPNLHHPLFPTHHLPHPIQNLPDLPQSPDQRSFEHRLGRLVGIGFSMMLCGFLFLLLPRDENKTIIQVAVLFLVTGSLLVWLGMLAGP